MEISYWVAGAMFALFVVGGVWYFISLAKKNETDVGTIVRALMNQNIKTVFLFIAFVINSAEAGMCASIHPVGDQLVPNPIVRMSLHLIIAVASLAGMYLAMQTLERFFSVFKMDIKTQAAEMTKLLVVNFVLFVLCFFFAIIGPIGNLLVVGNAAHQIVQLIMFWKWVFGSETEYVFALYTYNLPKDYMPLQEMSSVVFSSLFACIMHGGFILIEGFSTWIDPNKIVEQVIDPNFNSTDQSTSDAPDAPKSTSDPSAHSVTKSQIEELLKFFGVPSAKLAITIDDCIASLDNLIGPNSLQLQAKILDRMNELHKKIEGATDADSKIALKGEISKFFSDTTQKEGFDVQIPN